MKLFEINLYGKKNNLSLYIISEIINKNNMNIYLRLYYKNKYSISSKNYEDYLIYNFKNTNNFNISYFYIYKFLIEFYIFLCDINKKDMKEFNKFVIYNYIDNITFVSNHNNFLLRDKNLLINNICIILCKIRNNGNLDGFITK